MLARVLTKISAGASPPHFASMGGEVIEIGVLPIPGKSNGRDKWAILQNEGPASGGGGALCVSSECV